jgi:hypothetical protein
VPSSNHRNRDTVSGTGACNGTAPNKLLEPTLETNAAQQ